MEAERSGAPPPLPPLLTLSPRRATTNPEPIQVRSSESVTALSVSTSTYRAEPVLHFSRCDKRADHATIVVAGTLVQHVHPEVISICIGVTSQVTEVFHQ